MSCPHCQGDGVIVDHNRFTWACPCPLGDPHRDGHVSKHEAKLAKKLNREPRRFPLRTWVPPEERVSGRDRAAGVDS